MQTEQLYIPKISNKNVAENTVSCDLEDDNTFLNDLNEIQTSLEVRNITEYCISIYSDNSSSKSRYIKPNDYTKHINVTADKHIIANSIMSSNESDRLSHISNGSYQSGEPNNVPESADLNSWVDEKSDNPYSVNFRLRVWNISGLKSKLHEQNESFDIFVNTFDIIGFVETWADENDMF